MPLISVVAASKNAGATIGRLIESFSNQTYPNKELIIVDGASTDNTVDILKQENEKITYWKSEPDGGIYPAWNKALEVVRGEWICFFGADDYFWSNDSLASMVPHLITAYPERRVVYGKVAVVSSQGNVLQMVGDPWENVSKLFMHEFSIPHQGIMHHRTIFDEHGLFDENFRISGDYDLLLRELKNREAVFVPDVIVTAMQIGGISSQLPNTPIILSELRQARANNGLPTLSLPLNRREWLNKTRRYLSSVLGEKFTNILADGYRMATGKARIWTKPR